MRSGWTTVCMLVAVLHGMGLAAATKTSLRACSGGLVGADMPSGWQQLAVGPLAPFRFSGSQLLDPPNYPLREHTDAFVYDPALCNVPRSGVEAVPTYDASSLRIRHDDATDTFVVTGTRPPTGDVQPNERSPFVAFRRVKSARLIFTTVPWKVLTLGLAAASAIAIAFAIASRRAKSATPYGVLSLMLGFLTLALVAGGWFALYFIDAMNSLSTYH